MGDLNKTDAASITQLTGSDTSGAETNTVKAYGNNNLAVADVIDAAGTNGDIAVSTTAVVARVGGSNHPNRKFVRIYNSGTTNLAFGFKNNTTFTAGANRGETLLKKQTAIVEATAAVDVYVISSAVGGTATITEG